MASRACHLTWALVLLIAACAPAGAPSDTAQPTPATPGPATPGVPATPTGTAQPTAAPTEIPTPGSPPASVPPSATAGPTTTPAPPVELAWSELDSAGGPEAREDHTWTVNGDGSGAYLFGGRAGGREFNDLWFYDLRIDEWSEVQVEGEPPEARFGHTSIWVEDVGLVMWSGQAGPRFFADTWAYDPPANSWRELPASGDVPPARYGSCAALGPDGRMWISHGFTEDTGRFSDTRAYDFDSGSWTDLTPDADRPVERCLHDCLWTPGGQFIIYAGQTTGAPAIGDLWSYEPSSGSWNQAAQPEPEPRQLYALAQLDGTAFISGGAARDGTLLGDLWLLDLASLAWSEAEPAGQPPSGRFGASLIADGERNRLLLFGGKGDDELADLWQLSLAP
ncbi:hypothetical protein BH24CHL6_BH24CHL6_12420 [soil metagenome]